MQYFLGPYAEESESQKLRIKHLVQGVSFTILLLILFYVVLASLVDLMIAYKIGTSILFLILFTSLILIHNGKYNLAIKILNSLHIGVLMMAFGMDIGLSSQAAYLNLAIAALASIIIFLFINTISVDKITIKINIAFPAISIFLIIVGYTRIYDLDDSIFFVTPIIILFFILAIIISLFHYSQSRLLEESNEKIQTLLENAENRVEKLEKILPICSFCKRIRKEDENWEEIDSFLHDERNDIGFSHSVCPDCSKKYYGIDE